MGCAKIYLSQIKLFALTSVYYNTDGNHRLKSKKRRFKMKTTTTTGGFFGRNKAARNAAGLTATIAVAGTIFATLAPVLPVQADPPAWAKHDKNERRDDQRDVRQDKRDIGQDLRRLHQDKNDLRQDQRDVRRDDNRWDNDRDRRPAPPRPGGWDNNRNDNWRNDNRPGWDNNRNDNFRDRFDYARQQDANRQKKQKRLAQPDDFGRRGDRVRLAQP